jgi:N-acetyl-beta-hexosaminidase
VLAPSEELFVFLKDIFNELMDIFPSKLVHIGADECAKRWWEESESTKQYMRERGIADFNLLQKHFVEKLSAVMSERGRVIVGWDEMIDDGLYRARCDELEKCD